MDGYRMVSCLDLHIGDEVIVKQLHYDYDTGRPTEPTYYRTIVDQHRTVSGMMFDLVSEPNIYWPMIPPWMNGRIYAGNTSDMRMYVREDNNETNP